MPHDKISILSTRPLEDAVVRKAAENNICIETISFIETEAFFDEKARSGILELSRISATVVFTSMNAAEVVGKLLNGEKPAWTIYCIGSATNQVINQYFPNSRVAATANSAIALAEKITADAVEDLTFFCGDRRRDELPAALALNNIVVTEVVVYRTILTPRKVPGLWNGVLFFSPSAVESFFRCNNVPENTVLFAIGGTTADAIKTFCKNKIIVGEQPGKNSLAEKAIAYFHTTN